MARRRRASVPITNPIWALLLAQTNVDQQFQTRTHVCAASLSSLAPQSSTPNLWKHVTLCVLSTSVYAQRHSAKGHSATAPQRHRPRDRATQCDNARGQEACCWGRRSWEDELMARDGAPSESVLGGRTMTNATVPARVARPNGPAKRQKVESTPNDGEPLALLSLLAGSGGPSGSLLASADAESTRARPRNQHPTSIRNCSQASGSAADGALRDERPHKCPVAGCGYAAKGTGHLKRHIRTHTGEKPFKCPWDNCSYASAQSTHLTAHMRKHTGERPFSCPVAGCSECTVSPRQPASTSAPSRSPCVRNCTP